MKLSRRTTIIILALTALFFGFTLLHASWLADAPKGAPKLVADRGVSPVIGPDGCVATANSGYGAVAVGPDLAALQLAAGAGADAVHVELEPANGQLVPTRQFDSKCAADLAQPRADIYATAYALSKPELFWQIKSGAAQAMSILALPIEVQNRSIVIADKTIATQLRQTQPSLRAFSIRDARQCAADYRGSLLGSVPESCAGGVMLLTLDEIGFTLWGWPNRFLARMADARTTVIIAESVEGNRIKGLTSAQQYGEIAQGFNGYIWIDRIEELGPALRR